MRTKYILSIALVVLLAVPSWTAQAQTPPPREYEVTIVFIGLMSMDLGDDPQPGDPVKVIIPDISKEKKLNGGTAHLPKHIAYVLADRSVMTTALNPSYSFKATKHPSDPFHYLPFRGYYLSVSSENDAASLNPPLSYDNTGCEKCPKSADPAETGKLCWLSSMKTVMESTKPKDKKHFATYQPELTKDVVAGRMVLPYGTLSAYVVRPGTVWDFKLSSGTYATALAQETHWKFKARGVPFILDLKPFQGTKLMPIAFMPQFPADPNQPGKLLIVIGHTIKDEAGPMQSAGTPKPDQHYAAYYRFIDRNPDGVGPLPQPEDSSYNCQYFAESLFRTLMGEDAVKPVTQAKDVHSGHDAALLGRGPDPTPGGLNCSSNQWP